MALIDCPECGRQISDQAEACPQCGYPIRKMQRKEVAQQVKEASFSRESEDANRGKNGKQFVVGAIVGGILLAIIAIATVICLNQQSIVPQTIESKPESQKEYSESEIKAYDTIEKGIACLQSHLKDPNSLEVYEIKASDSRAYFKYTATNSYGGRVTEYAFYDATIDMTWVAEKMAFDCSPYDEYTVEDFNEYIRNR